MHIDSDLYSSAKFVLSSLHDRLEGAVVVFDEIYGTPWCEAHEGRAFVEFLDEYECSALLLACHHEAGAGYLLRSHPRRRLSDG